MAVLMYNGQPIASTKYGEMLQTMRDVNGVLKGDGIGSYAEASAIDLEYNNTTSGLTATNTQDAIDEIDTQLNEKANKVVGTKIYPTLINGWEPFDANIYSQVYYFKDDFGFVHFHGLVKTGAALTAAFVLPAGYRPAAGDVIYLSTRTSANAPASPGITSNGNFVPTDNAYSGYVVLTGLSFKAEA